MTLVSLHHVSVAYDGCEALRDVDLQIDDRDFLGVIGPNGGGKTTLVKAILGTVPYTGEIVLSPELFRGEERLIGYMPQLSEFDRAFPISILEIVLSGLQGDAGSARATRKPTGTRPSVCSRLRESPKRPATPWAKYRAGSSSAPCSAAR